MVNHSEKELLDQKTWLMKNTSPRSDLKFYMANTFQMRRKELEKTSNLPEFIKEWPRLFNDPDMVFFVNFYILYHNLKCLNNIKFVVIFLN